MTTAPDEFSPTTLQTLLQIDAENRDRRQSRVQFLLLEPPAILRQGDGEAM
jgi:hypothetical protein